MTKKNQTGKPANENFIGESGSTWINEIYGDEKNLKGNAVGGNDTITGGNDGAKNHLYGDAHSLKENAKGGVDTITGGSNGATNYIYGDAYSMEGNAKGGVDTITGGANGATNYIYGDAYRMKGNVQGGNDILVGGLNAKNFIYGDAFSMSNGAKAGDDAISLANASSLSLDELNISTMSGSTEDYSPPPINVKIQSNSLIGDADNIANSSSGSDSINVGNNSVIDIKTQTLQSVDGSIITASSNVDLDISKNSLIGDAQSLKNSSSGNDTVAVGSDIESKLDKIIVSSSSNSNSNLILNSKASASSTVSINLSSNRLVGDAENIASSSAGHDSLSVGDNLKSTVAGVVNSSNNGNAVDSDILLNFKYLDNILFGDADKIKNSTAGDDAISVGNNIQNTIGKYDIRVTGNDSLINPSLPIISSNVLADFTFSGNELIGDAATIERSAAGKDALGIGNNFQSTLDSIESTSSSNLSFNASETMSYKASNNRLIGDAKNMIHSSSGADTIGVGNNLKNSIGDISVSSAGLGKDKISVAASYFISENSLIGDSLSIKNSSAGDDILEVGNNFSNVFQKISNIVNNGKTSDFSLDSNFTVSNNSLMGDAVTMSHATGGDDQLHIGNTIKNKLGFLTNNTFNSGSSSSDIKSNFLLSNNFLIGDSKTMNFGKGGADIINLGNDFENTFEGASVSAENNSTASVLVSVVFNLSDNTIIGDSETMSRSEGGNDIISLGNGFVSTVGEITSSVVDEASYITIVPVFYNLKNNNVYGDAETMSYSKGGNDTLSIGVGIVGDSYLTLDIKDNTLYGDANTMQRSQGGDDKLTGADGEDSVTYLYGDAKCTDGKSGAGNDTLISGHGNDHMWGDFGGNLNQNVPYVNYSTGKDIFVFGESNGNDTIYDFQRGLDKIDLRSLVDIDNINDLTITSSLTQPSDSVINLSDGNSITLIGVNDLSANDFMFAAAV
jgi:hypothetical protein